MGRFSNRMLWAAAVVCLAGWGLRALPANYSPYGHNLDEFTDCGELILHRVRIDYVLENGRLPLASLTAAVLSNHAVPKAWPIWRQASGLLAFMLLLGVGSLLGSFPSALAAAALLIFSPWFPGAATPCWYGGFDYSQSFYTLLILLVAGVSIWREQAPSSKLHWMLGLCVGATFLDRSVLAFYPPLLLLWECSTRERRSSLSFQEVAVLGIVPYLFLLPWAAMNWRLHHRLMFFENGPANPLIALAALGHVVRNNGAERSLLIDVPVNLFDNNRSGSLLFWALQEIFRHPMRYGWSCVLRLRYALLLNPLLAMLGFAGWACSYRKRSSQVLALLICYLLGIHCVMAAKTEYFEPLWPLLALLAAPFLSAVARTPLEDDSRRRRLGLMLLRGWFCAVVLLCALAVWAVSSYALYAGTASLDQAVARNPNDAWLLYERGKTEMASGDFPKAAADLASSLRLRPAHPQRELMLAWVKLMSGDGEPFLAWRNAHRIDALDTESHLFASHGELKLGLKAQSRADLKAAFFSLGLPNPEDPRAVSSASAPLTSVIGWERSQLGFSPAERLLFVNELIALAPRFGDLWIERSLLESLGGDMASARKSLARAIKLNPISREPYLAKIWRESGNRGSIELSDMLLSFGPRSADLWIERALLELKAGRAAPAHASLARALALSRSGPPAGRDHADRDQSMEELRRIAFAYQEARENRKALELLTQLALERPGDASLLGDKGLSEFLNRDETGAIKDLEAAIRLDARLLPPYLTLGSIYTSQKRFADALDVYNAALSTPDRIGDEPLRGLLLHSRQEIERARP